LEQEKTALAEDRGREIEGLKAAQAQLESEKSALVGRREEAEKLAAERLKQINELQQQIQSRQAGEADLAARQQMMHEEMVRAEAQLDLIKDMLLREPGL
jgi:peptidoglycan hydrolase CwlO-like protein